MTTIAILGCATCSLDSSDGGQLLLVVTLLTAPLVASALGVFIVRRLLRKLEHRPSL